MLRHVDFYSVLMLVIVVMVKLVKIEKLKLLLISNSFLF